MATGFLNSESSDKLNIHKDIAQLIYSTGYRHGATKMVAKGKIYGKKKARDLISLFADLSVSPTKSSMSALLLSDPRFWRADSD